MTVLPDFLWEILVPTVRPNTEGKKFFTTRFHRTWDVKVRGIAGGLSIFQPAKGQWVSPGMIVFTERMIPVRIMCSLAEIHEIAEMTAKHYEQEAVMYYRISDHVHILQTERKNDS